MHAIFHYAFCINKSLKWNIISSSIIGAATLSMAWFIQPLFAYLSLPLYLYGILIPVLNLTTGTVAMVAYRFEKKVGFTKSLIIITMSIPGLYLAIGVISGWYTLFFLFMFYMFRGIATPTLKNHINAVTPSEIRATVLSFRSLIIRLTFVGLGPVLGWYADFSNLPSAIFMAGVLFLVTGLFASMRLLQYRHAKKSSIFNEACFNNNQC